MRSPYLVIPVSVMLVFLAISGNPPNLYSTNLRAVIYLLAGLVSSIVIHYLWIFLLLSILTHLAAWIRALIGALVPILILIPFFALYVDLATMHTGSMMKTVALIAPGFPVVYGKSLILEKLD